MPGGTTPFPILEILSKRELDWQRVTVWPGDDRLVPEDHPASNTGRIRALLEPAGAEVVTLSEMEDVPHFALAWLGMGALSLRSPLPFMFASYDEGILMAFGIGMIVAAAGLWLNMTSWLVPAVATLIVNALFFVLTAGMDFSQGDYPAVLLAVGRAFLLPSFIAAWLCWLIARRLLRA